MTSAQFVVNVEAALVRRERWLLIQRGFDEEHQPGRLALVGGKVDDPAPSDETLEATLRREIAEEVGVAVTSPLAYVSSAAFVLASGVPVINVVFAAVWPAGAELVANRREVLAVHWLTLAEIEVHPEMDSWTKRYLALAGLRQPDLRP